MARTVSDLVIDKQHARRFLLAHQSLLPPRKLSGARGVLELIRRVNCIQYDPIDVVGHNGHLVLQSRIRRYKPSMLSALLYDERSLIDGFDKQMSIYPAEDWPDFAYYRRQMADRYMNAKQTAAAVKLVPRVRKEIRAAGPLSSLDLEDDTRMDWWLAGSVRAVRIAMDILFYSGETVVHHRTGSRRYFDLRERTFPGMKPRASSIRSHEDYLEWHVYRRAGGVGVLDSIIGAEFGGLIGWQGGKIRAAIERLVKKGRLARIFLKDSKRNPFYVRASDLPALDVSKPPKHEHGAAFVAPLDNLMWDRSLVESLFDFKYTWEVYLPSGKRRYGYYVLPVLYGDRLIARAEPVFDRSNRVLEIKNWWWEECANPRDESVSAAIETCLCDFARYLGADEIRAGESIGARSGLKKTIAKAGAALAAEG